MNHALRPLGMVLTWEDFDRRSKPDERSPSGDWDIGALHRNVEAAGALLMPVDSADLTTLTRWNPEQATLTLWSQDTLGCVMHVAQRRSHRFTRPSDLGTRGAKQAPHGTPSAQAHAHETSSKWQNQWQCTCVETGSSTSGHVRDRSTSRLGSSLPTRHSTNDGCCGTALRLHAQKAKEGGPDRGSVFHLLPFDLPSDPFPFLFYSFSTHFLLLFYSFLLLSYSFVGG